MVRLKIKSDDDGSVTEWSPKLKKEVLSLKVVTRRNNTKILLAVNIRQIKIRKGKASRRTAVLFPEGK